VEPDRSKVVLKARLERIITKLGGIVEQNTKNGHTSAFIQISGLLKAKNVIAAGLCDVIKYNWLLDCDIAWRALKPSDMIYSTESTEEAFKANYDIFGDSFAAKATLESLKFSMDQVVKKGQNNLLTSGRIADFEDSHNLTKFGLFRRFTAFFVTNEDYTCLDLPKATFAFYGGKILSGEELSEADFVFVPSEVQSGLLQDLKAKRRPLKGKFRILKCLWIDHCLENEKLEPYVNFEF
jgi:hypothetical protein